MKRATLVLATTLVVLGGLPGCRTFEVDDFLTEQDLDPRLPELVVQADAAHPEMRSLMEDSARVNMFSGKPGEDVYGLANLKMKRQVVHSVNHLYFVATIASLSLINILGFPWASQSCDANLTLDIVNANGETIGHYEALGEGLAFAAYYWGYSALGAGVKSYRYDLSKAAICDSIHEAMKELLDAIQADAPRLRNELLEAGAVPRIGSLNLGASKSDVLRLFGEPLGRGTEEGVEIWSYGLRTFDEGTFFATSKLGQQLFTFCPELHFEDGILTLVRGEL